MEEYAEKEATGRGGATVRAAFSRRTASARGRSRGHRPIFRNTGCEIIILALKSEACSGAPCGCQAAMLITMSSRWHPKGATTCLLIHRYEKEQSTMNS